MTLLDDTLQLLSNEYRRNIMYHMKESEEDNFNYGDITGALVEDGYVSEEEEERFGVQMAHVHLPKMEESGLIEQDEEKGTVRYIPSEDVENLLEDVKKYDEHSEF